MLQQLLDIESDLRECEDCYAVFGDDSYVNASKNEHWFKFVIGEGFMTNGRIAPILSIIDNVASRDISETEKYYTLESVAGGLGGVALEMGYLKRT